jgi:hypothetical protein
VVVGKGSLREAVVAYLRSDTFRLYKPATVKQRRSMFELIMRSSASSGCHVLGDSLLVDWLHGADARDAVLRIMGACGDKVEAAHRRALGDPYTFGDRKSPPILSLPEDVLFAWCHARPEVGPAFVAGVASVLASDDANALSEEFHPIIRRLLDEFGDRDDVLKHIEQNIFTFGWAGSLTTYFALYQAPLKSLENHPKGPVRR